MLYTSFSLNGTWEMAYMEEKYNETIIPKLKWELVKDCVPGYWEDMKKSFQTTDFFRRLKINPSFGMQSYPISETAPDMALPNIVGTFFYKKNIDCIENENENECFIHFEGVQNSVLVWINDVFLGGHQGYSTPFDILVPPKTLKNGENTIILCVSNHRLKGAFEQPVSGLTNRAANEYTGGITGNLELRAYNSQLRDVYIEVSNDLKKVSVNLEMTDKAKCFWQVLDGESLIKEGECDDSFSFDTDGLEFWSPEYPKLYTFKITCSGQMNETMFGVRSLVADGLHFKLNNIPYYLRGICEHCYFPDTIHPNHDYKYYRSIIKKIKSLGFNFIRFHTFIPEEEYMRAADELGILLQIESPNNTTLEQWEEIVKFCRKHSSVVILCCGNEIILREPRIEFLEKCADIAHKHSNLLFSPMNALKGVASRVYDKECKDDLIYEPFTYNPKRLKMLESFSDVYNAGGMGHNSYESIKCDPKFVDRVCAVLGKPQISHEICIDGTYTNLELKNRYKNLRVGETDMFSSIERHLTEKGLIDKAPTYFKNSSEWQRRVRKYCFESARMSKNMSGYDFLGPIDTHWHTFGYDVGMMNEFYELKPGETVRNVLMYNSSTVLLNDLAKKSNFYVGQEVNVGLYASHYGKSDLENATLSVRLFEDNRVVFAEFVDIDFVKNGSVSAIYNCKLKMPKVQKPTAIKLYVTLEQGEVFAENEWELYVFPTVEMPNAISDVVIAESMEPDELKSTLKQGKTVVLLGSEPFADLPTTFRISLAGRTSGNLATVINDHPILRDIPNDGFCGWQFNELLEDGAAICFNNDAVPFDPIIEVVSTHKFVIKQSALFEFSALGGKLLVCSFNFNDNDPCANWLKANIIKYVNGSSFEPKHTLTEEQLDSLMVKDFKKAVKNENVANNPNDITYFI